MKPTNLATGCCLTRTDRTKFYIRFYTVNMNLNGHISYDKTLTVDFSYFEESTLEHSPLPFKKKKKKLLKELA